ncbi:hypothetical protein CBS147326_1232 [Penicillium roqueforti]|nr:hypothetical protein CBS147326_1232 [Penicillium roqueforti]
MPWRPDEPVELPNGRLVCRQHGLVVCGYCTVDYSFMDDDDDDDVDDDDDDVESLDSSDHTDGFVAIPRTVSELRVGTGGVFPTKFMPPNPNDTPKSLFPLTKSENALPPVYRFIRRNSQKTQFLVYTDGACLDNGGANPRAGCSFVYRNSTTNPLLHGFLNFPLEKSGPTGIANLQTSNRAELRAVIAATRFRYWLGEGCRCLVIATDSEYVVEGITKWVKNWIQKDWKTSGGTPVKNKDLWQCLLGEMERWDDRGMRIQFWRIPRELNTEADELAKLAADKDGPQEFEDIKGVLV